MINNTEFFEKVLQFIREIGIETDFRTLPEEECFLPGLLIQQGRIIIDKDKLSYAGDILHEAAHIAVTPADERPLLDGPVIGSRKDAGAEEMMAIAWSYAACIYLHIDPVFVFHEQGYKGGGASIVENFRQGRYIGVPVLQWLGMTNTVTAENKLVYPVMIKWMRD
ncbi:MAG: hypothetical protein ABIN93_10950 [Ginsengibacter sp.]